MVLVPGLLTLGMLPLHTALVVMVAGMALALVGWGVIDKIQGRPHQPIAGPWRFFKAALPWIPAVALPEWLATEFVSPPVLLLIGSILIIGLLLARGALGAKIDIVGKRCAQCGATYIHGSPFFTDLDANPRNLTAGDVPRPLGISPFVRGASVDNEPEDPPSGSSQ